MAILAIMVIMVIMAIMVIMVINAIKEPEDQALLKGRSEQNRQKVLGSWDWKHLKKSNPEFSS